MPAQPPEDEKYVQLDSGKLGLNIEVQKVDHASRVHLDIVAKDVEAEVQRLEKLGASRIKRFSPLVDYGSPDGATVLRGAGTR